MLLTEEWDGNLIVFIYDEAGSPIGFKYRASSYAAGTFDSYIYGKNLQGDIVAIYNTSGTAVIHGVRL